MLRPGNGWWMLLIWAAGALLAFPAPAQEARAPLEESRATGEEASARKSPTQQSDLHRLLRSDPITPSQPERVKPEPRVHASDPPATFRELLRGELRGEAKPIDASRSDSRPGPTVHSVRSRPPTWTRLVAHTQQSRVSDSFATRDRSASARLQGLQKPLNTIRLGTDYVQDGIPENQADGLIVREDLTQTVTATGLTVPLPDRYTIGFRHRPLYFQQLNLERCGRGHHYCQNVISGAQFLANTVLLPYHLAEKRPDCVVPTQGDCQCCEKYPCHWRGLSGCGVTSEAAVLAGFSFLLL